MVGGLRFDECPRYFSLSLIANYYCSCKNNFDNTYSAPATLLCGRKCPMALTVKLASPTFCQGCTGHTNRVTALSPSPSRPSFTFTFIVSGEEEQLMWCDGTLVVVWCRVRPARSLAF